MDLSHSQSNASTNDTNDTKGRLAISLETIRHLTRMILCLLVGMLKNSMVDLVGELYD